MGKTRSLHGKLALVTGAASGIGRAIALALAERGARLIVCDLDDAGLATLAPLLGGSCVVARRVDVANRAEMLQFAQWVHEHAGVVDILVNNAGVGLSGGLLDTPLDDLEWALSVNLWGVIHGCHAFVPKMVERGGGGHVVNVASAFGYFAAPGVIGYAASKFAVVGFSESLRAELAPHHVGVSVVCPGLVATSILGGTRFFGKGDPEVTRRRVRQVYDQRSCSPERVATATLRAIARNTAVVPVSLEAWALYYLKRYLPRLGVPVGRLIAREIL